MSIAVSRLYVERFLLSYAFYRRLLMSTTISAPFSFQVSLALCSQNIKSFCFNCSTNSPPSDIPLYFYNFPSFFNFPSSACFCCRSACNWQWLRREGEGEGGKNHQVQLGNCCIKIIDCNSFESALLQWSGRESEGEGEKLYDYPINIYEQSLSLCVYIIFPSFLSSIYHKLHQLPVCFTPFLSLWK